MKVGNIVKWHTDTAHFALVSGIVIDTYMSDGDPSATVFWFDLGAENHHHCTDLITISEA